MNRIRVRAPSNIALIKYMGKEDVTRNLPSNPSLSMTLSNLCTVVELEVSEGGAGFSWSKRVPDARIPGLSLPELSDAGVAKFSRHVERMRAQLPEIFSRAGLALESNRSLACSSANTFPSDAGIASSASAFAALTWATALAWSRDADQTRARLKENAAFRSELAGLSRQGSGSSCRSFSGPFVKWDGDRVEDVVSKLPELTDLVLLVSRDKKSVSSSQAHTAVTTSPLWQGRAERARAKVTAIAQAIAAGDLKRVAEMTWLESWEMHSLFHTSTPPFTYWKPESLALLEWLKPFVESQAAPIVTMDAGPNVHLIVPTAQAAEWRARVSAAFPRVEILSDPQGHGVSDV